MDRTTDEHDRKALRRIAAVLLALADLAERASGRSPVMRCLVLWLLRSGEVLAREHLAGLTRHAAGPAEPMAIPFTGDSAAEAMRLAASFRALAAALAALAGAILAPSRQAIAARRGGPLLGQLAATSPLVAFRGSTPTVGRLDSS